MLRLARYLKPYRWMIVTAIILLFVQANSELALPDYLSRIVNVGIQQGGVESILPEAIRQSEMEKLLLFLSEEEADMVRDGYLLVDSKSAGFSDLVGRYPALAQEPVFLLHTTSTGETHHLTVVMGKALIAASFLRQVQSDPALLRGFVESLQAAGLVMPFDLSQIPPGADLFGLLEQLPSSLRFRVGTALQSRFDTLGESMSTQIAIAAVREEYSALGMDAGTLQNAYILRAGWDMLLLTLLSVACTIAVVLLAARTAAGAARDIRRDVFQKVESFSSAEFDTFSTASLITRSTNDITQIQMVVFMMMRMVFFAPIIGVGGIIRALGKSSNMWWIIALAVLVLIGLVILAFSISLPKFKRIQSLIDRLNLVTREHLTGMMVIRAFNMQTFEEQRFDKANSDLTAVNLFIGRLMATLMPLMMFIMNGLSILIIWVGAHQIAESNIQVGDMMAFMQYAMQIVFSFLMMSIMFIILPRAAVSGDRIADVLQTEPGIADPGAPATFPEPFRGTVEFRRVSFRYPGAQEDVLHDISFTAQPGETTAFVGSTGSGKSTIVNLIPRFYEATEGSVFVDGVDVREVTQHDLRNRIGYIPQKGTLFSGTIASNLLYADETASADDLREAIQIAQAGEFIFAKPEGMDAEISQGGGNISGGQKQRLAIARALVKKPPIYIFDDSFSALDLKTDAALRRTLREKTGGSTVLIVTQRISTIRNAEQIVVLEEGRVVGKGRHRELMEKCETYREMALSQLSREELE